MLNNPTIEKLQAMKFTGMLKGYLEQCEDPGCEALSFEERFGLLVDREAIERDSRRMQSRLRKAKRASPPPSKTSTTATRVDSTNGS